jgi:hypothetical protein
MLNGASEKVTNNFCGQPVRILEMSAKFCMAYEDGVYVNAQLRGQSAECPVL